MKRLSTPKHICLWFPLYIMAIIAIQSRWTVEWLGLPGIVSKVGALLLYLPFGVFICWKLVCDLKARKLTFPIIAYYSFAGYYGVLTVFRFLNHMEVKENLYYTIILLGSISLFSLIYDGHIRVEKESLYNDVCIVSAVLMLYMLLFVLLLKPIVTYSIINEIAIGGSILILTPLVTKKLWMARNNTFWTVFCMLILFSFASVVFTLRSRVTFVVFLFELAALIVISIHKKRVLLRYTGAMLGAVVLVACLFALNVGQVRYAVYREIGFTSAGMIGGGNQPSSGEIDSPDQQEALYQINRSDSMRADLLNMSIERVRENPLFGTGDVFYSYVVGEETFEAPAHNFVFASLNCYGLIGLFLLVALVLSIMWSVHLFRLKDRPTLYPRMLFLLTLVVYFGEGMVQATVYDVLVMPLMFIVFAAFALSLKPATDAERICQNVPT